MKRIMFYAPGDIRCEEAPIPTPGPGEIVMKNKVTLTCGTDVKTYKRGYRYEPPFAMGHEISGVVYAVGEGVTKFKVGDRIVAHNSASCGKCYFCKKGQESMCVDLIQNQFKNGGYAEYTLIPERIVNLNVFHLPDDMSFKQAALLEPLACALYGTEMTHFDLGDYVCVNGCGPIGLMFVRMCVLRGAHVIACDMTEERLAVAKKLGAIETINIKELNGKSQADAVKELTPDGRGVDAAIEAAGLPEVWDIALHMARPGGEVLFFGGTKKGLDVPVDTTLVHYSQLTMKGVFHTTPAHVNAAFEMLKMNAISADDFVQNEYDIEHTEDAIVEHSQGRVIKNCIVYPD
ncbi:MAG: alcohol dehydrogenase catalytic domain-containing protein [Erysipelotrichaceae bacterium]|nr:alcohol dehydrogenase catalytic domain-containing protein [Erysipelotrichaceae bacterium]